MMEKDDKLSLKERLKKQLVGTTKNAGGLNPLKKESTDPIQGATAKARENARNGVQEWAPPAWSSPPAWSPEWVKQKLRLSPKKDFVYRDRPSPERIKQVFDQKAEELRQYQALSQEDELRRNKFAATPYTKDAMLRGDEKAGRVSYSTPEGTMETGELPVARVNDLLTPERGTLTDLRRSTKSGGDFYNGVDVSQMTPQEYLQFKVDSMNRATDTFKEINRMKAEGQQGERKRPRFSPQSQGLLSRYKRGQLLRDYKKEIDAVTRELEREGTPLRGRKAKLEALNDYYQIALGLSPQAEEQGKTLREQIGAETRLAERALAEQGATDRTKLSQKVTPSREVTPKFTPKPYEYGGGLGQIPATFNERTGQWQFPPVIAQAKTVYDNLLAKGVDPETAKEEFKKLLPDEYADLEPGELP